MQLQIPHSLVYEATPDEELTTRVELLLNAIRFNKLRDRSVLSTSEEMAYRKLKILLLNCSPIQSS